MNETVPKDAEAVRRLMANVQACLPVEESFIRRGDLFSPHIKWEPPDSSDVHVESPKTERRFGDIIDHLANSFSVGKRSSLKKLIEEDAAAKAYIQETLGPEVERLGFENFTILRAGGHSITLTAENNGTAYAMKITDGKDNPDMYRDPLPLPFVLQPLYSKVLVGEGSKEAKRYGPLKLSIYPLVKQISLKETARLGGEAQEGYDRLFNQIQELISLQLQAINKRFEAQHGINPGLHIDDIDNPDNYGFIPIIHSSAEPGEQSTIMMPVVLDSGHIIADPGTANDMLDYTIRDYFPELRAAMATGEVARKTWLDNLSEEVPWYDSPAQVAAYMKHVPVPEELKEQRWSDRVKAREGVDASVALESAEDAIALLGKANGNYAQAQQAGAHSRMNGRD